MNNENTPDANEPSPPHYEGLSSKKEIYFFNSLKEQEMDNYKWLASLSPIEHMQYGVENIKRIFADELRANPSLGVDLTFV